ncbi:MAG TPA: universal stress protein [candidate division Zixibacteria bacterium]|nr:universal stress protein [candidate division Zixibacteria bacterium]
MRKVAKILAPTDFSELGWAGVRCAFETAKSQGAEVLVYHVIAVGDGLFSRDDESNPGLALVPEEQRRLEAYIEEHFSGYRPAVRIRAVVEPGSPPRRIVEKATEEKADLIVMSTHGRTGLNHILLGSVAEKVLSAAPCPLLVIPRAAAGGSPMV